MEVRISPSRPESSVLQPESARYYAELDAATGAFSAPWCRPKESFCNRGRFSVPAVPLWSVWSACRSEPRR
ncbi:MAG TPA: hypothetical protein VMJ34_10985 [Bryobacteraceae bacterium]|nr:hypothetical protein [Bryobacteraceae bacterium]